MIALAKLQRSADAPAMVEPRTEWMPTERERRAREAFEDTINRAADRAKARRFTGDPITAFGDLS